MAMKYSYFHHTECTTEQAERLIADYQSRGVRAKKSLNPDFLTWTVSAKLQECERPARTPRTFRQKGWGGAWLFIEIGNGLPLSGRSSVVFYVEHGGRRWHTGTKGKVWD